MSLPGRLSKTVRLPSSMKFSFVIPKAAKMDLGSSYTRVKIDNKIVFHDRTAIVFHEETHDIIALGQAAEIFQGRVPAGMKLVRPIRMGKVSDVTATNLFLKAVLKKVNEPNKGFILPFLSQGMTVAVGGATSQVQKELLAHFFRNLHASCTFKPKAEALFTSLLSPQMINGVWCCLDIGGMTTEVAIWANGQVISQQTLDIGGTHFTQQVLSVMKKKYQAEIGWLTAEQIKKNLLCLSGAVASEIESDEEESAHPKSRRIKKEDVKNESGKFTVRARSSTTDLPTTVVVSAEPFRESLTEVAQELVWLIKEAMQDLSPELLSTALENGLLITGGGSLLPGLANYIEKQLQTSVLLSSHPREDVIRGL